MKKVSVTENYIYSILYQALTVVTPLIVTPYITRTLGDVSLGAYNWTQSVNSYFVLAASLGIAMYGQREVAYVRAEPEKRFRVFKELMLLKLITVFVSIVPYVFFVSICGRYQLLFLIQSLDLVAVAFDVSWYLQGMENFKAVVGKNTAVKIVSVACIFIFVKKPEDIGIYALCQSGSVFLGTLSLWLYLPQYNRGIKCPEWDIKHHFLPVMAMFLPQIAIQLYCEMDKTMLGILNPQISETAYYTQAQKITKVAQAVVKAAGIVLLPRMSYVFSYSGRQEARQIIDRMFRYAVFLGAAMAAGIAGIASDLVPWFLGKDFSSSALVLCFLAPTILMISVSNVTGIQCLVPMKRQKAFNISVCSGAVINLVINAWLIPEYGAIGACIGTLFSEMAVMLIQMFYLKDFISYVKVLKDTWQYVTAALVMLGFLLFLSARLPAAPLSTLLEIFAGAVLYIGMLLLIRDPLVITMLDRIAGILRKLKK